MDRVSQSLLQLAPNCPRNLLFCRNPVCSKHYTACSSVGVVGEDYDWSVRLECYNCHTIWWLCSSCILRKKIEVNTLLQRHQYAYHSATRQLRSTQKKRKEEDNDH
jgi:hypothetical protein